MAGGGAAIFAGSADDGAHSTPEEGAGGVLIMLGLLVGLVPFLAARYTWRSLPEAALLRNPAGTPGARTAATELTSVPPETDAHAGGSVTPGAGAAAPTTPGPAARSVASAPRTPVAAAAGEASPSGDSDCQDLSAGYGAFESVTPQDTGVTVPVRLPTGEVVEVPADVVHSARASAAREAREARADAAGVSPGSRVPADRVKPTQSRVVAALFQSPATPLSAAERELQSPTSPLCLPESSPDVDGRAPTT